MLTSRLLFIRLLTVESGQRNVWDRGYIKALKNPNFKLKANDGIKSVSAKSIKTKSGEEIKADVIIFCTVSQDSVFVPVSTDAILVRQGFKARDYYFPVEIKNGNGTLLSEHLKANKAKTYKGVCVSGFPNLFLLLGAGLGHTSVTFTLECQVKMVLRLISPIFIKLRRNRKAKQPLKPMPSIVVRKEAEDEYHNGVKAELRKKEWDGQDGSFYVDPDSGISTAAYPGTMWQYWKETRATNLREDFNRTNLF